MIQTGHDQENDYTQMMKFEHINGISGPPSPLMSPTMDQLKSVGPSSPRDDYLENIGIEGEEKDGVKVLLNIDSSLNVSDTRFINTVNPSEDNILDAMPLDIRDQLASYIEPSQTELLARLSRTQQEQYNQ